MAMFYLKKNKNKKTINFIQPEKAKKAAYTQFKGIEEWQGDEDMAKWSNFN